MQSMQEEKQRHHNLFRYKEEEKAPVKAVVFSETAYGIDGAGKRFETTDTVTYATTKPELIEKGGNGFLRKEHLGELGTVAPGSFGLYEKHQAKKDEVSMYRNKIEEDMAKAAAVGAGGYTFREHHEKKEIL